MIDENRLIPFHSSDLTGKRILVLSPHPDDETIGCGGTLALHARAGDPVKVLFLTNGAKGDTSGEYLRNDYILLRQEEARKACACLGITDIEFWPAEDRELHRYESAVMDLAGRISEYQPERIYAPSPHEYHPDHRTAATLIQRVMQILHPPADLLFYEVNQPVQVTHLVDITPVLNQKKEALQCYRSQIQERPYHDISLSLSRFRSMTLPEESTYAEGFLQYFENTQPTGELPITPWTGTTYAVSGARLKRYALAVIVRTQGLRNILLAEALCSIANQKRPCLAVIVVHGQEEGLPDVESVCRGIPHLHYVILPAAEPGKLRGYPLNLGLQYCLYHPDRVEGIAFLDDDDILYPHFSDTMVQTLENTGADIAYGASNRRVPGQPPEPGYQPVSVMNLFVENFIPINSYAIRYESWARRPVWVDETLEVTEDWHFLVKLMENGFSFSPVSEVVSEFRLISDGNSLQKSNPEIWSHASARIQNYIQNSRFPLSGRELREVMLSALYRNAEQESRLSCLQDRITELEQSLASRDPESSPKPGGWFPAWVRRMMGKS
jgi:LmbE family N-acetylglucosaminyl deacetylase